MVFQIPLYFFPNDYLVEMLTYMFSMAWFFYGIVSLFDLWEEKELKL